MDKPTQENKRGRGKNPGADVSWMSTWLHSVTYQTSPTPVRDPGERGESELWGIIWPLTGVQRQEKGVIRKGERGLW